MGNGSSHRPARKPQSGPPGVAACTNDGTEVNTECWANIVPPCQGLIGDSSGEPGSGVSDPALAEGDVIRHHPGIEGGSDLDPEIHCWTDPVARVTVERTG